jgi:hypothetical protein
VNTVRDRLWIWGHEAGAHNGSWGLQAPSRMTPAEGAYYLGIPNMIMVRYANRPAPPFDQYALAFTPLRRVVWSIVGDASTVDNDAGNTDIEELVRLGGCFPNVTGAIMDDFFRRPSPQDAASSADPYSRYPVPAIQEFRRRLRTGSRPLELWVVLYAHDLDLPIRDHLAACDTVTFWTWQSRDLSRLEENIQRAEAIAPAQRKILGCYMHDYGNNAPMPVERMEYQCRKGLEWLREGRIVGMIFLASCICDLGLETVEYTRRWIAQVGDQVLG